MKIRLLVAVLVLVLVASGTAPIAAQGLLPPGDSAPPTMRSRLQAADGADWPDAHALIVLDEAVNRVDARGVTTVDREILYKILDEEGCRDLAVLRWNYDPQSAAIQLEEVNILRDEETIAVDVGAAQDLPAPQAAIYWSDRIILLQLPRLEPGDGIQVKTSKKGFTYALLGDQKMDAEDDDSRFIPPMPGEYFDVVLFAAEWPILEKRYELRLADGKRVHSEIYNGALYASTTYESDTNIYAWWGFDLPPEPHERRQPAASDFSTKVVVATVESWEAKSRWFFDINNNQFESTPEIDAMVETVLDEAGVADGADAEKAEALLHWVAQNIRYSGQTMGAGEGFTLHPGAMIFEQRSGVCKDIAGMLVTMMRAADIPANPAMTMAGSRIEEVPADQFNHCVVARQEGEEWVMYDPTWVPYNNDIWSKLETEQHYLVGSSSGETLSQIPYSPPDESPLLLTHSARLGADGSLEGTIRLEGSGASDGRLRRIIRSVPSRRLDSRMAGLLAVVSPAVEIRDLRFHKIDDFTSDMWIEIDYRSEDVAVPVDGGLELTTPGMAVLTSDGSLFAAAATRWPETRETDVLLYMTQRVKLDETIELPAGSTVEWSPDAVQLDETYASFQASVATQGKALKISAEAEVKRRQIPPAGYAGFRSAMEAVHDWSDRLIRVAPVGGAS